MVELLAAAAPELAHAPDAHGHSPLHLILQSWYLPLRGCSAAFCLVRSAPAAQPALGLILAAGQPAVRLLPLLVARLALTAAEWCLLPSPCPQLAAALPAVVQRSAEEAGWLVARLEEQQRARLLAAALCLSAVGLPRDAASRILPLCLT
jgi:hypothetical protein